MRIVNDFLELADVIETNELVQTCRIIGAHVRHYYQSVVTEDEKALEHYLLRRPG